MVHRTARLDRRWARCVRRACTAPPYSVWQCLLCAAHRGRHSRTPKPARCQHVASTPGIGHPLRCGTCSRLLTEARRGGPRRCSRRRARRLAQPPPPVRSASVVKQRDVCGCRWPHTRGARHGQGRHPAGAMPEPRRASKRARRACRGMPEPAWWSPDAGYVQGRLRGALVPRARTRAQGKFGGIDKPPGMRANIGVKRYTQKLHRFTTTLSALPLCPARLG